MDTSTRAALENFLCHLTNDEVSALVDVLSSHVLNAETVHDSDPAHPFISNAATYVESFHASRLANRTR